MMHSLHKVNKLTERGYNKPISVLFLHPDACGLRNRAFNESRWQAMEQGQFVFLIHQSFGCRRDSTQEWEWRGVKVKVLGAPTHTFQRKSHPVAD